MKVSAQAGSPLLAGSHGASVGIFAAAVMARRSALSASVCTSTSVSRPGVEYPELPVASGVSALPRLLPSPSRSLTTLLYSARVSRRRYIGPAVRASPGGSWLPGVPPAADMPPGAPPDAAGPLSPSPPPAMAPLQDAARSVLRSRASVVPRIRYFLQSTVGKQR